MSKIILLAQSENVDTFQRALRSAVDFISVHGLDWLANIAAALMILIIGRWIAKLIRLWSVRILTRANIDATLGKFLGNIAYALLLTLVIVSAVSRLGVDTTSFAAILAAAGLAVGLALQNSLSNFAAGVMIILFRPFRADDYVEAAGTAGVIEEIHIFHTMMRTGDNRQIIVPNSSITNGIITNFSTKSTRRIDLVVGCGYNDDLREVKGFLKSLLRDDERILPDPEPVVAVNELADSRVSFVVRPWVNAADYWAVRWDLNEAIKLGFDTRGFTIPYPSQDVYMHQQV